jgi:polysaccharide pyruvyl transferase WcaK-like protein
LLIGDATYDDRVMLDLRRVLRLRGLHDDRAIVDEPMASHEDVLSQLAATDYVVASRFHNVLLALMLNKPVLAISYHEKIDALMAGFGLQEYCQDIERLDLDRVIEQLTALERNAAVLKPRIARTSDAYRKALDSQYHRIFNLVMRPQRSSPERQFATSSTALSS